MFVYIFQFQTLTSIIFLTSKLTGRIIQFSQLFLFSKFPATLFIVLKNVRNEVKKQKIKMPTSIRICHEGHANALALNKQNDQIAVAGRSLLKVYSIQSDGFVEVCNMRGGKNQNLSYSSNDVAWSFLENNILATAATNGVVSVWDLSRFGRHKQLLIYNDHERTAHSVTFHTTEPHFLISGSQDGTIKRFDTRIDKGAVTTYFSNSESVRDVKFNPQNPNTFAAVSENGTVQLWDTRKQDRCQLSFPAHSEPIYTCDWHPTQQWLATGSRDRQIKIWNMGPKPSLEYTIQTIAVVGRIKWRPEKMYHLASCALVVDYSIYIWDVRRPFIPYCSFNEHTNVTTGIGFKGNDPYCLLSTSKDSTIFKHSLKDANRPALRANPQGASINFRGDLIYAYKLKPATILKNNPSLKATLNNPKSKEQRSSSDYFHLAKSNLLYHFKREEQTMKSTNPYDCLKGFAKEYKLSGKPLSELCDHNMSVAKKYGKYSIALLWSWVKMLYSATSAMPAKSKAEARTSNSSQINMANRLLSQSSNQSTNMNWDEVMRNRLGSDKWGSGQEYDEDNSTKIAEEMKVLENKLPNPIEFSNTNGFNGPSHLPVNEMELTFNDFVFEDRELTIDSVAKLRNGFLYTGPHDICKELMFPNNLPNCSDLHSAKQQETLNESAQETASPTTTLLKVIAPPTLPSWEPHDVFSDCLMLQVDIGDVQTAVCILIALGNKRSDLPIDESVHENWLLSYIDILQRHELWNEATQIMNYSWISNVMNEQSTAVHTNCGQCGKPMSNAAGWYCNKCRSADASKCSLCQMVVRGIYVWCQACSHGGHFEHLRDWFQVHSKCPTCGHLCEFE